MATPYETLHVAPNASQEDSRKAYRKAAKETHPGVIALALERSVRKISGPRAQIGR